MNPDTSLVHNRPVRALADMTTPCPLRYYAWEIPVRLTHWLIFASVMVLAATGIYMGRPFIVVPGEARFSFVMGTMRAIHFYAAIVFCCSVLARLIWMFTGNYFAKWHQFIPATRERRRELYHVLRFYLFLDRQIPACGGHNALAGLAYTAVYFLYMVEIVTGLALYSVSAHVDSPLRSLGFLLPILGGAQTARLIHHVVMWLILAFAVHHVYSAWMVTTEERNATLDSIFSGYRYCHAAPGDADEIAVASGEKTRKELKEEAW